MFWRYGSNISVPDRYTNETTTEEMDVLQQDLINLRIREVNV